MSWEAPDRIPDFDEHRRSQPVTWNGFRWYLRMGCDDHEFKAGDIVWVRNQVPFGGDVSMREATFLYVLPLLVLTETSSSQVAAQEPARQAQGGHSEPVGARSQGFSEGWQVLGRTVL